MCFVVRGAEGHRREGYVGEDCISRCASGEVGIVAEIEGDGFGVIAVHVFDDALFHSGVFGRLVGHGEG